MSSAVSQSTLAFLPQSEFAPPFPAAGEEGFGAVQTPRGNLPLTDLHVEAKIEGLFAEAEIVQTFRNGCDEPLEAIYIFPLPDRMAVGKFVLQVGEREIAGVLKERGAARREYRAAIEAGHRAALTEEERPGVFTMQVGNIPPGESVTVRLTMTGIVPCSRNEATFRFPLVVAERYLPGKPLDGDRVGAGTAADTDAVPDASRISPPVLLAGSPNPVRFSLCVELDPAGMQWSGFRSSLHAVWEAENAAGVKMVTVRPGERLDRDFVLRWNIDAAETAAVAWDAPDESGNEGTFAVLLAPPTELSRQASPRDIVFVLDRSGSMEGWKMVAARAAVARMISTLTPEDRFNVLAFDDRIETPPGFTVGGLTAAWPAARKAAEEAVRRIEDRGGTEMAEPLRLAAHLLGGKDAKRERILVLITDGQTGGEDQILRTLGGKLTHLRVYTLGIDRAVNAGFLQRLAQLGNGQCDLVESEYRLQEVIDGLEQRIGTPVLTDITVSGKGLSGDERFPERSPALLAGAHVLLTGRRNGPPPAEITVKAVTSTGKPWEKIISLRSAATAAVRGTWARGRVRELEDRWTISRTPQLERQIVNLSETHQVLCRFTAYVAVDRTEIVNAGGKNKEVVQPVEPTGASAGDLHKKLAAARPARGVPDPAATLPPPSPSDEGSVMGAPGTAASAPPPSGCAMPSYSQAAPTPPGSYAAPSPAASVMNSMMPPPMGSVPNGARPPAAELPTPPSAPPPAEPRSTLTGGLANLAESFRSMLPSGRSDRLESRLDSLTGDRPRKTGVFHELGRPEPGKARRPLAVYALVLSVLMLLAYLLWRWFA